MKLKNPKKITLWVTVASLSLYLAYVGSFLVLKSMVVEPYERKGVFNVHGIRNWYNRVYYPLRWLSANRWSPVPHRRDVEGFLENIDESNITVGQPQEHRVISIGFPPDPGILRSAIGISKGDCVVVRLGVQLVETHDRFVNQFLGIAKCTSETEPGSAANGIQPIPAETNSTSPAAGSRR